MIHRFKQNDITFNRTVQYVQIYIKKEMYMFPDFYIFFLCFAFAKFVEAKLISFFLSEIRGRKVKENGRANIPEQDPRSSFKKFHIKVEKTIKMHYVYVPC